MTPTISIATPRGEAMVTVEIASTPDELARGLMFRTQMPAWYGMLFIMPSEQVWSFYMRNTLIPLDMIYVTHDWKVAGVYRNAEPLTEDLRGVGKPSSYVLETNAGWAAANQVVPGAAVRPNFTLTRRV